MEGIKKELKVIAGGGLSSVKSDPNRSDWTHLKGQKRKHLDPKKLYYSRMWHWPRRNNSK